MKARLALGAALVAMTASFAAPATAAVGGYCDGKIDVACRTQPCVPDLPCNITICLVWYGGRCLAGG